MEFNESSWPPLFGSVNGLLRKSLTNNRSRFKSLNFFELFGSFLVFVLRFFVSIFVYGI